MKTDREYLESVLRDEFNMIRDDEIIYKFEGDIGEDSNNDSTDNE